MVGIWEAVSPASGRKWTAGEVWDFDDKHDRKPSSEWSCPTTGCPVLLHHRNGTDERRASFVHPRRVDGADPAQHLEGCIYDFAAAADAIKHKHHNVVRIRNAGDPNAVGLDLQATPPKEHPNAARYHREVLAGAYAIARFIARHEGDELVLERFRVYLGSRRYVPWVDFSYGPDAASLKALSDRLAAGPIEHIVFIHAVIAHGVARGKLNGAERKRYSARIRPVGHTNTAGRIHAPAHLDALVGPSGRQIAVLSGRISRYEGLPSIDIRRPADLHVFDAG